VNAEFNNFLPARIQTSQTIINMQTIGFFKPPVEKSLSRKKNLVNVKYEKFNQTNMADLKNKNIYE